MRHIATFALALCITMFGNTTLAAPASAPPAVVTTASASTPAPVTCPTGMTCTTVDTTGKVIGVVVGPALAPVATPPACPTGNCSPPVAPAETCTMGWCTFTTIGSYIGGGTVLGLLSILGLIALGGGLYVLLTVLPERRRDRRWHRRTARHHARWRAAARRSAAAPDDMDLVAQAEEAWGRYVGHTQQATLATVADYDADDVELPPPPPVV